MRRYRLVGARGGQGTTTVATVVDALAASHGPATLAATRPDDVAALAGLATGAAPACIVPGWGWWRATSGPREPLWRPWRGASTTSTAAQRPLTARRRPAGLWWCGARAT